MATGKILKVVHKIDVRSAFKTVAFGVVDLYEQKLLCEVKNTENALLKLNNMFALRCKKLAEVIKDPWGNPILNYLLVNPEAHIGPKGKIGYFCFNTFAAA